jgi:hypothetical protein
MDVTAAPTPVWAADRVWLSLSKEKSTIGSPWIDDCCSEAGLTAETRRARRLPFYWFPLRGRKTIITSLMATQPSYPNLRYYIPSYCLIYLYGADLFFSGLSPEKKKYFLSANSASRAKRAVKTFSHLPA